MNKLRFGVIGCGFWSKFQIAGWYQVGGVELAAVFNRTTSKAAEIAREFDVPAVYADAAEMMEKEELDFVDIITAPVTHRDFVQLAAEHKLPVICQKPMANDLALAEAMVQTCREAGVPLFIHENWRWQWPIQQFRQALAESGVGRPFRARITFSCSFPVFDNQPFLREEERFILTDIGSHILDTARSLFGEVESLNCTTARVNPSIRGEDVATVLLRMKSGATVVCEMSYASVLEDENFPQTYILAECENGSIKLGPQYRLSITDRQGTRSRRCPPPHYAWADPAYDLVHASIVDCNRDLLHALRGQGRAATTGDDNLQTMRLVYGCYDAAESGETVRMNM